MEAWPGAGVFFGEVRARSKLIRDIRAQVFRPWFGRHTSIRIAKPGAIKVISSEFLKEKEFHQRMCGCIFYGCDTSIFDYFYGKVQ
jgi:hypothetical protein